MNADYTADGEQAVEYDSPENERHQRQTIDIVRARRTVERQ